MPASALPNCPGPRISRRTLLTAGSLSLFGLGINSLIQARSSDTNTGSGRRRVKGVLLVHTPGAPSHIDTLDPKPDAPAEIRGSFSSISTSLSGVRFTEHVPRIARHLDKMTLIRSMRANSLTHEFATHMFFAGATENPAGTGLQATRRDRPHFGAVLTATKPAAKGVPHMVVVPNRILFAGYSYPGQNAGFMGPRYDPWFVNGDPNGKDFGPGSLVLPADMTGARLADRASLMAAIDSQRRELDRQASSGGIDDFRKQATDILTSSACREAFDINKEDPKLRDHYGRHSMGQSTLLGRRLIEAGVPLVQVNLGTANLQAWDTHADNFNLLKKELLPPFDRAVGALIEDMSERGLLNDILVVVAGEFGRAPMIGKSIPGGCGATPSGRDHWAGVYSMLAFGAGVGKGQVIGASDKFGAYPSGVSYSHADLGANFCAALGLDPTLVLRDELGQSYQFNTGTAIPWG
jgi:hypothetical protein